MLNVENSLQIWFILMGGIGTIIEIIVIIQVDFLNKTLLEKLTDFITSLIKLGNLGLARALRLYHQIFYHQIMYNQILRLYHKISLKAMALSYSI